MFCFALHCAHSSFEIILVKERAGCFVKFVFPVSPDWSVILPRGAVGLSAVCNCGIS